MTTATAELTNAKRQELAKQIARSAAEYSGVISHIKDTEFYVRSQSDPFSSYRCSPSGCECSDWTSRHPSGGCKHMRAAAIVVERMWQSWDAMRKETAEKPQPKRFNGTAEQAINDLFPW